MIKEYKTIVIEGSNKFIEKTIDALDWIKKSDEDYKKVLKYLKKIKQSSQSMMVLDKAQFNVGIKSAYHCVEWYAGIIVHDVHHYYLHTFKEFRWIPKNFAKHERLCFDEQARFLKKIRAPDWMIEHVNKSYSKGHWRASYRKKKDW